MNKLLSLILTLTLLLGAAVLTSCSKAPGKQPAETLSPAVTPPLDTLKEGYTEQAAAEDGCVILEGQYIIAGEARWLAFLSETKSGNEASVRLYQCYHEIGGGYYVKDLIFDGKNYRIMFWDRKGDTGEEFFSDHVYPYLLRDFHNPNPKIPGSTEYYLLTDNLEVTADGYFGMLVSSTIRPEFEIYSNTHICLGNRVDATYVADSAFDVACADLDGDGDLEKVCLGLGQTSGLFTFSLSLYDGDERITQSVFCTPFYTLSFMKNAQGVLTVKGVPQSGGMTRYYSISLHNGTLNLTDENGVMLDRWGEKKQLLP